jgi:hypothetical protein
MPKTKNPEPERAARAQRLAMGMILRDLLRKVRDPRFLAASICPWFEDPKDHNWDTGCGRMCLVFPEAGPKQANFQFCPYCGKAIA